MILIIYHVPAFLQDTGKLSIVQFRTVHILIEGFFNRNVPGLPVYFFELK